MLYPLVQFEIRYNNILDFTQQNRELLAPFVKMSSQVMIQQQKLIDEKIKLSLGEIRDFTITADWDRLIFRSYNSEFYKELAEQNFYVQTPFFDIFDKIKELESYGEVRSILLYIAIVKPINNELDKIIADFTNNHFGEEIKKNFEDFSDAAIVFDQDHEGKKVTISHGGYTGLNDLRNLQIEMSDVPPSILMEYENIVGELATVKIVDIPKNVTFSDFKDYLKIANEKISKLWTK